jgi:hypothetical protein
MADNVIPFPQRRRPSLCLPWKKPSRFSGPIPGLSLFEEELQIALWDFGEDRPTLYDIAWTLRPDAQRSEIEQAETALKLTLTKLGWRCEDGRWFPGAEAAPPPKGVA